MTEKKLVGSIDMTPSWMSMAPVIIAAMENGTPDGVKMAKQYIYDLAKIADAYVAEKKGNVNK